MWAKLHSLIGQKQQNSFQYVENLFVSIRFLDNFQPFMLLF